MGTGWPSHLSLSDVPLSQCLPGSWRVPTASRHVLRRAAGTGRNGQESAAGPAKFPNAICKRLRGRGQAGAGAGPEGCGMRSGSTAAHQRQPGQRGTAAVTATPWGQQSQRGHKAAAGKRGRSCSRAEVLPCEARAQPGELGRVPTPSTAPAATPKCWEQTWPCRAGLGAGWAARAASGCWAPTNLPLSLWIGQRKGGNIPLCCWGWQGWGSPCGLPPESSHTPVTNSFVGKRIRRSS